MTAGRPLLVVSTDSFFPREGGAEKQMRLVGSALVARGWDVVVVARRFESMSTSNVLDGVQVVRVGGRAGARSGRLRYVLAAARTIRSLRPDAVISIQAGASAVAARLASARSSVPHVLRLTGIGPDGSDVQRWARTRHGQVLMSWLLGGVDAIASPARHLLRHLDELGPAASAKGIVVHNGVAPAPVERSTRIGRANGGPVVWVGRSDPVKRLDHLVALADMTPDVEFVAVGPTRADVASLPNLHAVGWVAEPRDHLAKASVVVSTSASEGSPGALLEALHAGVPVVAYDIPAMRELAELAGSGVTLVPDGDIEAMARTLARVRSDQEPVVVSVPSIERAAESWDQLLHRLMSPSGHGVGEAMAATRAATAAGEQPLRLLQPLRIALVIGTLGVGGTETQLVRFAAGLRGRGHAVKIFVVAKGGPLADRLDALGLDWELIGFRGLMLRQLVREPARLPEALGGLRDVGRLWWAIGRFRPDVCHAYLPWAYMLSMPGARLLGVRARIASRRGLSSRMDRSGPKMRLLHPLSTACAHAIVANSDDVAADAIMSEGITNRRVVVIPNGVELPEQVAEAGRADPVGLMVANLHVYKGHDDLLDALALLETPPRIRIVGRGSQEEHLRGRIAAMGLVDAVVLEGGVDHAAPLWLEAQFGLLVSHHEGMPNAVLEAMAAGVPMIATAVGGVPELVEDGVTGLLVPPHDPVAIGKALTTLCSEPELRIRLGEAARAAALEFSWDRNLDRHEALYRSTLQRSGRRRARSSRRGSEKR